MDKETEKQAIIHRSNISLVNGLSLIILTITAVVALWLVAPRSNMLLDLVDRSSSPEIALAFLSAIKQDAFQESVDQQNRIKLLMIKNFLILNRLDEAESIIEPMLKSVRGSFAASITEKIYLHYIDLLLARYNEKNGKKKRWAVKKIKEFFAKTGRASNVITAKKFAQVASSFSMPDKAYQFLRPFLRHKSVSDRELLKLALQYGNYQAAIFHQKNIFEENQTIQELRNLEKITRLSGENTIPFSFFERYQGDLENNSSYLEAAISSSLKYGEYQAANQFYRRLKPEQYANEQLSNFSDLALQFGQLDLARETLQVLTHASPTPQNLKKLHDVLLWQSDIVGALALTERLIALNNKSSTLNEKLIRQGINEARAIGDMLMQAKFFSLLASHDYLKENEVNGYIDIQEKVLGSLTTLAIVDKRLEDTPHNKLLLAHKLRILGYLSRHQQIAEFWNKNKSLLKIGAKQATEVSGSFQRNDQPLSALHVLTSIHHWQQFSEGYIQQVFTLAWSLGERQLAIESQMALMKLESFDGRSAENIYYYVQLHKPFKLSDIDKLITLYKQWDNERLLVLALDTAVKHGDHERTDELLELAELDPRLLNNFSVLSYSLASAMRKNDHSKVDKLFTKIQAVSPNHLPLISTYLWWLMDSNQRVKLADTYNEYKLFLVASLNLPAEDGGVLLREDLSVLMALTAAGHRLGLLRQAEALYQQVFQFKSDPKDEISYIQMILNYAQLLDLQGNSPKAYQLRSYVAQHYTEKLLSLGDENISYISLVGIFSSQKDAQIVSEWQTVAEPSDLKLTDLYSRYIANQRFKNLYFWNERAGYSKYKIPHWEQLSIAIKRKDKRKIKQLLDNSLGLPPADENFALQMLGLDQQAWEHGEEKLARLDDKNAQKQLRFIHVGQHPMKSNGYGTKYQSLSKWDIQRASIFYYQPTEKGQWRVDVSRQDAKTSALFSNISKGAESRLKLKYRAKHTHLTENTAFRWSASIDLADGFGDLRTGISADLEFSIDDYWQAKVKLGFDNAYEASQLATLVAKDNVAGLNLDYSPTKRERLSLGFNFHDLNNRFGENIGLGWDSSIRISERLFFSDPGWEIYAGLNVQKFNLSSQSLNKTNLNLQFLEDRPIVSNDFIDDKYAHIGIGQRLFHGIPMLEGATVPSPRYWLDTAVGYNLISRRADVTISTGLGWRILGDDELSFSVDWQSQDINGDASLQIALGYYYNL